jgi:MYXO-CTERM domain-containing protein
VPHVDNVIIQPGMLDESAAAGGDHLSLATPGVIGDPVVPTAGLALNYVDSVGDSEITTDLQPFGNLPSDDILHDAGRFHVFLDVHAQPGTYHKIFYLGFSDQQDLPGANAPGSFVGELEFNVTVTPEPSSLVLAGMGAAAGVALAWRRRRALR